MVHSLQSLRANTHSLKASPLHFLLTTRDRANPCLGIALDYLRMSIREDRSGYVRIDEGRQTA